MNKVGSRNEAWKVMRNTFHNYDKNNTRSIYFVVALSTSIVVLLSIRFQDSVIIISNAITITAIGIGYNLGFGSLRASLAENKILRQKILDQAKSEE